MDLSKLSDDDLMALQKGDMSKVSDEGLTLLSGSGKPSAPTSDQQLRASIPGRMVQGVRDVIDAGAQGITKALPDGVVSGVNKAVDYVNRLPVVGPLTTALGMTPASAKEIDQGIAQNERAYQDARKATGGEGFDAARLAGNVAVTAPMASAIPAGLGTMGREMAIGAGSGAAFGLAQPVLDNQDNYWTEKGKQALTGAGFGAIAAPIGQATARVISPNTRPEAKLLMKEGVTPTPGQLMGGFLQRMEDKATSLPIVGDAISYARRQGLDEFNRAAYARALKSISGDVPTQVGREGVRSVKQTLGNAYDDLLPKMGFSADNVFKQKMGELSEMVNTLPRREAREFANIIAREIDGRLTPAGTASGETLKAIESQLGKEAKRFSGSTDAYQKKLADALMQAQSNFRDAVTRGNPQLSQELANINSGYANYARIRDAASRSGSESGVFTPAQLAAAVRAGDKSVGKGSYAGGTALMQDLTDAGKTVLASKYPDSGTAARVMQGGGAAGAAYLLDPSVLTGIGAASAPYLPGGRQLAAALLAKRPEMAKPLAEGVKRALPPAIISAAPPLIYGGNN